MTEPKRCRDFGERAGCLGDADERYTMRFDDLGEPPIYWCAFCGPEAHAMDAAIGKALDTRPGFAELLEAEIAKAERKRKDGAH